MSAYKKYWLYTAFLTALSVYAVHLGAIDWFLAKFSDMGTQASALGIMGVFLYGYAVSHGTAYRIAKNEAAIQFVLSVLGEKFSVDEKIKHAAELLTAVPKRFKGTAVFLMFQDLLERKQVLAALRSPASSVPVPLMQELFDAYVEAGYDRVERIRLILFYLGLLGTVIGIVLALAGQGVPGTPEEAKLFSFGMMKGMGLAYITSMVGMSGALVLYFLQGMLERNTARLYLTFTGIMFVYLLPVVETDTDEKGDWGEIEKE